jgi:hypothetical protein
MSSVTNTMNRGSRIFPGVLQSISSEDVSSSYAVLGTFSFPVRIFKITNDSTEDVTVSWDGTHAHEYVPAGSFILLDVATNAQTSGLFAAAVGQTLWVKGTSGTGSVYLSYYYAIGV